MHSSHVFSVEWLHSLLTIIVFLYLLTIAMIFHEGEMLNYTIPLLEGSMGALVHTIQAEIVDHITQMIPRIILMYLNQGIYHCLYSLEN